MPDTPLWSAVTSSGAPGKLAFLPEGDLLWTDQLSRAHVLESPPDSAPKNKPNALTPELVELITQTVFLLGHIEYAPDGRALLVRDFESAVSYSLEQPAGAPTIYEEGISGLQRGLGLLVRSSINWMSSALGLVPSAWRVHPGPSASYSPDGAHVALGYSSGQVRLIDAGSAATLWTLPTPYYTAHFSFNSAAVATFAGVFGLLFLLPTLRLFDRGNWLYIWPLRPNPYLYLYDLPGIEHYIPVARTSRPQRQTDAGGA